MIRSLVVGTLAVTVVPAAAPVGQQGAVAAGAGQVEASSEVNAKAIPINRGEAYVVVPISDSVRAATWDRLQPGPTAPVHLKVACLVYEQIGVPGACIDATLIPQGAKTVDWLALRALDQSKLASMPTDAKMLRAVVQRRISTLRLKGDPAQPPTLTVRLFDEVVSAADARPVPPPAPLLDYGDVVLTSPLDPTLLDTLYPFDAMRYKLRARVEMRCRVQSTLRLLCRDPGKVTLSSTEVGAEAMTIEESFRLAAYQLASTIELAPEAKDGRRVLGSDVKLVINWQLA